MNEDKYFIAIDPGREKCGIAVLTMSGNAVMHEVISTANLPDIVENLINKYAAAIIAIGSGTTSKEARKILNDKFPQLKIIVIDEYRTTDAARKRYWLENPPRGWRKFVPVGMLVPTVPIDDFAALIIGEKFLQIINKHC